jgi:hypothetical protein
MSALFIIRAGLALPVCAAARRIAHCPTVRRRADYVGVVEFAAVIAADIAARPRRRAARVIKRGTRAGRRKKVPQFPILMDSSRKIVSNISSLIREAAL